MRVADVGLAGFKVGECGFGGIAFAQITAEDGVDESGLRTKACLFGLLDGFIDGGVAGNAVQPENLVEPEPQEILQHGFLSAAGGGFAGDQPIQRGLPADDAVDEFLAKAAINRGQVSVSQRGFEDILHEIRTGGPALQNLGSNLSWFLLGQFV